MDGVQCKKCRYLLKDKDGHNWCSNKIDDPDIDLIRDCKWYAVKTNADRIRSMTDEELARFMGSVDYDPWQKCDQCKWESCEECCFDWLREEAE